MLEGTCIKCGLMYADGPLASLNILPANVVAKSQFGQPTTAYMVMETFPVLKGNVKWQPYRYVTTEEAVMNKGGSIC